MKLEQRIINDVALVTATGDITASKGADMILKDKINSLLNQGYRKLLIDLGGVSYVDSSGLGQLAAIQASVTKNGGAVRLLRITRRLNDLLVLTRLVTIFRTFDDEATALASFGDSAPV
jgi:anti-sigma B factor antagonist